MFVYSHKVSGVHQRNSFEHKLRKIILSYALLNMYTLHNYLEINLIILTRERLEKEYVVY